MKKAGKVGVLIAGLLVMFVGLLVATSDGKPGAYSLRQGLERMLKDPDSAEFRHENVYELPSGQRTLCGEVNAKNSFGGYTGFKRFVSGEGSGITDDGSGVFETLWTMNCIEAKLIP